MTFVSTDPQNHQGENTWFTPKLIIDALGGANSFDMDPCTQSFRPFNTARMHIEHDSGGCGLSIEWSGRVWLNPPYGKEIGPFINKFMAHKKGIALIFARMGNKDVQALMKEGANFFYLRNRVKFISKSGDSKTNAGADSALCFFGDEERQVIATSKLEGVFRF